MRFVANDTAAFARMKSNADQIRSTKASFYCNEIHIAYLKQGVVMHEVVATSDNGAQLDFTFDKSSCDNLPKAKLTVSKTLAEWARTVAKAENDSVGKSTGSPFQLSEATAHEDIVDEHFIVRDAAAKSSAEANRDKIAGVLGGYFCGKYHDVLLQGLVFHHFFVLPDGSPVIDFIVDRSNC
jgi:hypothetical protein